MSRSAGFNESECSARKVRRSFVARKKGDGHRHVSVYTSLRECVYAHQRRPPSGGVNDVAFVLRPSSVYLATAPRRVPSIAISVHFKANQLPLRTRERRCHRRCRRHQRRRQFFGELLAFDSWRNDARQKCVAINIDKNIYFSKYLCNILL